MIRHGENGLLVDFFDGGQLVQAVQKVLANPDGMHAMQRAAATTVQTRYDREQATAHYLALVGCAQQSAQAARNINGAQAEPSHAYAANA